MVLNRVGMTGVTGMLGRHTFAMLKKLKIDVISTSHQKTTHLHNRVWDLNNWLSHSELNALFDDVQAIIHIGAMVPDNTNNFDEETMFATNVRSCLNLGLWAIERDLPLIYISGAIVYKEQAEKNQNESSALGWNTLGGFYGYSKLLGENVLTSLRPKGLKLSVLRPSSIYGTGLANNKMIRYFLNTAMDDGLITLSPPTDDSIDFIHASDVAAAIIEVLQAEQWGVFNIASGIPVSIKSLAESCLRVTGKGEIRVLEETSIKRNTSVKFSLDTSRANQYFNWLAKVDLERGLDIMVQEG